MSEPDITALLSALLLAADKPLNAPSVAEMINAAADEEEWPTQTSTAAVNDAFDKLKTRFDADSGVELIQVAGGWRLRTAPQLSGMVRRLWPERRVRLSKASLEVLAVVAYRQPCTRHEVEGVRGVDCGGVLRSLMERRLVRIVGRMDEPGRPLLYGTTPLFLETFSLNTLKTLPTLRDLESLEAEEDVRAMLAEQGLDALDIADDGDGDTDGQTTDGVASGGEDTEPEPAYETVDHTTLAETTIEGPASHQPDEGVKPADQADE